MKAWICFAEENGYAGRAEQFLYDGFSFCGAEPFYLFLKQASDQNDILKQMFSGKNYGKNSDVTFRLLTHLFALMLNDEAPSNILAPVIKCYPSACQNKEGKRLGTAVKTFEKYLLNILSPAIVLHPLNEIDLKPEMINSFLNVLSSLTCELKQTDSLKQTVIFNIARIEKWAGGYLETVSGIDEHTRSACEDYKNSNHASEEPPAYEQGNHVLPDGEIKRDVYMESLQEILICAQTLAGRILKENDAQKKRIMELESKNHNKDFRLAEVSKKLEIQEAAISDLNKEKYELENQCRSLKHMLDEKENLLKEKDIEIAGRIKISEALSRDRSRQADESLQRIASKIKVEYRNE